MPTAKSLPKEPILTAKQKAFIFEFIRNGENATAAYKVAFNNGNSPTCQAEGNRLSKLPYIAKEIDKLRLTIEQQAAKMGINHKEVLKQIKKLLYAKRKIFNKEGDLLDEVEDFQSVKNGAELLCKLLGWFPAERRQFEGPGGKPLIPETDLSKLNKEELKLKKEELLRAMRE